MTVDEIFAPFITHADEPSAETEAAMAEVRRFLYLHDNLYRITSSPEFLQAAIRNADALGLVPRCAPPPDTSHEAWVSAVNAGDTDLGYEDWAHEMLTAFDEDES